MNEAKCSRYYVMICVGGLFVSGLKCLREISVVVNDILILFGLIVFVWFWEVELQLIAYVLSTYA